MVALNTVYNENDMVSPAAMAEALHITVDEVAGMIGISSASLKRADRRFNVKTQTKLKDMLNIINLVTPWAGSELQAYAWYRSTLIPALGNITAETAVKMGHSQAVRDYLETISLGGYA
jgi:hypothetical protein